MIQNITIAIGLILSMLSSDGVQCNRIVCTCVDATANVISLLRSYNYTAYAVCGWGAFDKPYSHHIWTAIEINNIKYEVESFTGAIIKHNPSDWIGDYRRPMRCVARGFA